MKRMDIDSSNQEDLKKLLQENALDRNKNINTLIKFINAIDGNYVLNLDGDWGTGKTVFLKEIEILNSMEQNGIQNLNNIEKDVISDFQKKYDVFYFNSWENDLYNSPLESLIYELLFYYRGKNEGGLSAEVSQLIEEKLGIIFKVGIKILTGGTIELADLKKEKDSQTQLITSINEKKEAVKAIIETLTKMTKKKLLIIIDELDRCKPTYAVEYLEVVKHFFTQDNVIFLFGTNKTELVNTVKQSYGINFDGYKYLNRFFDFEFNLPKVEIKKYVDDFSRRNKLSIVIQDGYFYSDAMKAVCSYFNFSFRDINRYYTLCNSLNHYWTKRQSGFENNLFVNYVMTPFLIGLKIHDGELVTAFFEGNSDLLISFCQESNIEYENLFLNNNSKDTSEFNLVEEIDKIMTIIREEKNDKISNGLKYLQIRTMRELISMLSDITIN